MSYASPFPHSFGGRGASPLSVVPRSPEAGGMFLRLFFTFMCQLLRITLEFHTNLDDLFLERFMDFVTKSVG
jgi:hypothetical protein